MTSTSDHWDYLILTASNETQAGAYRMQLAVRQELGLLQGVRRTLVVADPDGRRVGSGGSTVCCLMEVLRCELAGRKDAGRPEVWDDVLRRVRILIVHAGGDSRRLPAYGPCGKVFIPLPGNSDSALGATLFDRQLPVYLRLPSLPAGLGQVVITSGDVLLGFDPEQLAFREEGLIGVGCAAEPEQASGHGVFCVGERGQVRRFLQKPSPARQARLGALNDENQAILDIGVLSFNAVTALELLDLCRVRMSGGRLAWHGPIAAAIVRSGLDFYREICCAMGADTDYASYCAAVRDAGSKWSDDELRLVFDLVSTVPFHVQLLKQCDFLHFGGTRQIIGSGRELLRRQASFAGAESCLSINNAIGDGARLAARNAWVEGCNIEDEVTLSGDNLLVGVDVRQSLRLPAKACLDVLPGRNRRKEAVCFIRCYFADDRLHGDSADEATLCGMPISRWLQMAGCAAEEVWDSSLPVSRRSPWNARLFPGAPQPGDYPPWLWMFAPDAAGAEQWDAWRRADRYSMEEMALLADLDAFHDRRIKTRGGDMRRSLRRYCRSDSGFSAADLAHILVHSSDREAWLAAMLAEARRHWDRARLESPQEAFVFSRLMHTLGSALDRAVGRPDATLGEIFPRLAEVLPPADGRWLDELRMPAAAQRTVGQWTDRARQVAFEYLRREIIGRSHRSAHAPRNALREDEIVWGRAPARLDLSGGWTDTPPYSLENGGRVLNAAVNLNDQPPIQAYVRVTSEPVIRLRTIDVGSHTEIRGWDELLDFASAAGEFSLVKAALTLAGFTPAGPFERLSLGEALTQFGGGLEITTLAAIPKGSGLGTSSIMGAVITAVIHRVLGRQRSATELFHEVLCLEQALTTGGGWQDQIGGVIASLKLVTTQPGLVPEAAIRYVPADVLDPALNGGQTLLYYTGMTRLAKNILQDVVGRYLDRDRDAMHTLRRIHALAGEMTEAMAAKDLPEFGRLIDVAWQLNKRLDPHSSNAPIEALLDRVRPHIHGAKLLGAGGGGFLLLVCKSADDANRVRATLTDRPPDGRARFFKFDVSQVGLAVSVC